MLELMDTMGLEAAASRRREVLAETMRSARANGTPTARRAVGSLLVSIGHRVGGELTMAPESSVAADCM